MTVLRSHRQKSDGCLHAKGVVRAQNALEGPSCKAYHSFSGEEPQTLEHAQGALKENPCHLGKAKCRGF